MRVLPALLGMGLMVLLPVLAAAQERSPSAAAQQERIRSQQGRTGSSSAEIRRSGQGARNAKKARVKTPPVEAQAGPKKAIHQQEPVWPIEPVQGPKAVPASQGVPVTADQGLAGSQSASRDQTKEITEKSSTAYSSDGLFASRMAPDATAVPASVAPRANLDAKFGFMEIEVSHSGYTLTVYGHHHSGSKDVLHRCNVGLGSGAFPTPVGEYYVTHIYDQDPWWIPPKDRAWAAGQSPSKTVYGGTMAPLLKKRTARAAKKETPVEDKIDDKVTLSDHGYRFHGTNAPRSIRHNQSHGCVRMLPEDAKKVAGLIKDNVGIRDRKDAANGSFVILKSPVRLNLVK